MLILGHFMACMWILLGQIDKEGSWLFANDMPTPREDKSMVWATAFYWIFEVFSTVGYGDFSYSTSPE